MSNTPLLYVHVHLTYAQALCRGRYKTHCGPSDKLPNFADTAWVCVMRFKPAHQIVGWRFTLQLLQLKHQDMELALTKQGRDVTTDPGLLQLNDLMIFISGRIFNLEADGKTPGRAHTLQTTICAKNTRPAGRSTRVVCINRPQMCCDTKHSRNQRHNPCSKLAEPL